MDKCKQNKTWHTRCEVQSQCPGGKTARVQTRAADITLHNKLSSCSLNFATFVAVFSILTASNSSMNINNRVSGEKEQSL